MKRYEAMFLFDPAVTADWDAVQAELNRLFERAGARVIVATRWDERRLAYEVRGRKRGIYALTYFQADENKIADLQRDARLSEAVLRVLVLQADELSDEEMKEIAARPADHSALEAERIGNRGGGGGGGGGGRGGDRRRREEPGRGGEDEGAAAVLEAKPTEPEV